VIKIFLGKVFFKLPYFLVDKFNAFFGFLDLSFLANFRVENEFKNLQKNFPGKLEIGL